MLNRFRASGGSGTGKVVGWTVLGLIAVGLTGLSLAGVATGMASQNVASVGTEKVARVDFERALQAAVGQLSRRFGTSLTMEQARSIGVDQQVMAQLITTAALDGQVKKLGVSIGDDVLRDALVARPETQGPAGGFDQTTYDFFLERGRLSAAEFENDIRSDVARTLLEAGISGGIDMPTSMRDAVLHYLGEKRGFSYVLLLPDAETEGDTAPSDADLKAFFEKYPDAYTTPETRRVTYVKLTPQDVAKTMEIDDEILRAEYDARTAIYNTPERRILDRMVFGTLDEAQAAFERVESGDARFDEIGEERGLSISDMEVGAVSEGGLPTAISELIFNAEGPGVYGPIETDLGPALYRINAILAARTVSFEDASKEIRDELALANAGDVIGAEIDPVQDLLAGGATLEDVANETQMVLATIDLNERVDNGIASDANFRDEAFSAEVGEERDMIDLLDGGIAAIRVDEIIPPTLRDFEEARAEIASDFEVVAMQTALRERAEALKAQLDEGKVFAALMETEALDVFDEEPVRRDEQSGILPAGLIAQVFELENSGSVVIEDVTGTYLVSLGETVEFDVTAEENAAEVEAIQGRLSNSAARDVYFGFAQAVQNEAGVSINQDLIDQTLALYP